MHFDTKIGVKNVPNICYNKKSVEHALPRKKLNEHQQVKHFFKVLNIEDNFLVHDHARMFNLHAI